MEESNRKQRASNLTKHFQTWSNIARVFAVIAIITVLSQAVSLVGRARRGASDFSVVYRTATLLKRGSGGELYEAPDQTTGWPRCIPPAGLVIFQPLTLFSPTVAGIIWSLLNLSLLVGAIIVLHNFFGKLERHRNIYLSLFPWALIILLILSAGSIQVGQFSVLFVSCWIFYLLAASSGHRSLAGLSLAVPSAIKLYPVLMLAVPLVFNKRRALSGISFFLLGILVICAVIPAFVYGPRVWELTTSFLKNTIMSPEGRVLQFQHLTSSSVSDQGLDAVLLRYLSPSLAFHSRFPAIPHLRLERQQVLLLANVLRLVVLVVSAVVVFRWRRSVKNIPIYSTLMMVALWSATLYLILPGAKSRYAVYAFIGFLPLLEAVWYARMRSDRFSYIALCALIVFCLVLILQLIPDSLRVYGLGILGSLALWVGNIRKMAVINAHQTGKNIISTKT